MSFSPPLREDHPVGNRPTFTYRLAIQFSPLGKIITFERSRSAGLQTVGGASGSRSFFRLLVGRNRKTGGVHPSAFPESFFDLYQVFAADFFPVCPGIHRKIFRWCRVCTAGFWPIAETYRSSPFTL